MKSDPEHLASLVERVQRWLVCTRWKKAMYGVWSVIKCKSPLAKCHTMYIVTCVCMYVADRLW